MYCLLIRFKQLSSQVVMNLRSATNTGSSSGKGLQNDLKVCVVKKYIYSSCVKFLVRSIQNVVAIETKSKFV